LDLPSFIWLWKIAAWSMGLAIVAYLVQAATGVSMVAARSQGGQRLWVRPLHFWSGAAMSLLVLLLLAIGIAGTLGHYGSLGHSTHLPIGIGVVELVLISAWSAVQISPDRPWARPLHIGVNALLCVAFVFVSLTGWEVVQKYL